MLISEKRVWKVISGEHTKPIYIKTIQGTDENEVALTQAQKNKLLKEIKE